MPDPGVGDKVAVAVYDGGGLLVLGAVGPFGSGGGGPGTIIGSQPSVSLSRDHLYTSTAATNDFIDFDVVDWEDAGAHFAVVAGRGVIVVDTPGRWWVTAAFDISDNSDGVTYPSIYHMPTVGSSYRIIHGSESYFTSGPPAATIGGKIAAGFICTAIAGDYFAAGGQFFGGVSPGFTCPVIFGAASPMILQAFLLKAIP